MSQRLPLPPQDRRMVLRLIGILLVATNLRAPITGLAQVGSPIWRHALAWQVTLFMGLNSFIYYVMIG